MERLLIGTTATLTQTWYTDGAVADPGPVTVIVTRSDGTTVAAGNASGSGADERTFTLTSDATDRLDALTVTWESAALGALEQHVEVVGGFLFGLAALRGMPPLGNEGKYPPERLREARTIVEDALEHACGVAFVPRFTRERMRSDDLRLIWVRRPHVRRVITVAEVPGDAAVAGVPADHRVIVAYEHGMDSPPPRVTRAGLLLARRWLVDGPADERATSIRTEDGVFNLVTPGRRGELFDLPEVNAVVQDYSAHHALVG